MVAHSSSYARFFLSDNPFPASPTVDPFSADKRLNGSIFNETIFRSQLDNLTDKLKRRLNLIYVQSQAFDMGVGKSAVLVWSWRTIVEEGSLGAGVYLRCGGARNINSPSDFAREVVVAWHNSGSLWRWLLSILEACAAQLGSEAIFPVASAKEFAKRHQTLPATTVNIRPFSLTGLQPNRLIGQLMEFTLKETSLPSEEPLKLLLETYLSRPSDFPEQVSKRFKKREALAYAALLNSPPIRTPENTSSFFSTSLKRRSMACRDGPCEHWRKACGFCWKHPLEPQPL